MLASSVALRAEPVLLGSGALDQVAAGGMIPPLNENGPSFSSTREITTVISMPIATATAICLFCSGNASAVAMANAVGVSQADALAFSTGQSNTFASSDAWGPIFMMLPSLPTSVGKRAGSK
jgi:hypothetical protein